MDNFIDRIAQRFSGQDVIRANAEAEAAEMRRLKEQSEQLQSALTQYDTWMQEVRNLNLRNAESAQSVQNLIANAQAILDSCREAFAVAEKNAGTGDLIISVSEGIEAIEKGLTAQRGAISELRILLEQGHDTLLELQKMRGEINNDLSDAIHKENVKVYRNVQVLLVDEMGKQTQVFQDDIKKGRGLGKATFVLVIISLLVGLANLGLYVFISIFGGQF